MKLARGVGLPLEEYLERVSGRDLALEMAFERVAGPQGEDRQDWRIAWQTWWIVKAFSGVGDMKPTALLGDFLNTLKEAGEEAGPDELITDDWEASEAKAKQLQQMLESRFPRQG